MVGASTSSGEADEAGAGAAAVDARRDDVDARGGCREGRLLRAGAAGVGVVGETAGAMCTGGARSGVGAVFAGAEGAGVVAGTATDALALLGALTSASKDGSPSRLCSAARSAACCVLASAGVSVRFLGARRGAEVVLVEPAEAAEAAEEDADDDDADDDDARCSAACSRASLARARLGRRCRRRRRWRWRWRCLLRWLRLRHRADEDAEETDAERDRRDGTETEAEAVERERRRGFRCFFDRFVGGACGVRRLLVVCPFAFRAAGLVGGLTGRGGGAVDRLWSARVPEAEADVDDEAEEPRLGPADTDASSSALDSDVSEERERVITGVRCVGSVGVQGARVGSLA